MKPATRRLWTQQDIHEGDRWRLFAAVAGFVAATDVLYPGSYVDVAASFVFPNVTYVDVDRRALTFFGDVAGIHEIIDSHEGAPRPRSVAFVHSDYTADLDLPHQGFDLLISLYAGFVSAHCTNYLRVGGTLLVNSSHGDAAMASIDERYELSGVVASLSGNYRTDTEDMESYLIPKKPGEVTRNHVQALGKGIAYTRSPFAYLFTRVR